MTEDRNRDRRRAPGLWQTVLSVLAAFFGVQSEKNRQRDFTHGSAVLFIAIGAVMTVLLVVGLVVVVQIIVAQAGAQS